WNICAVVSVILKKNLRLSVENWTRKHKNCENFAEHFLCHPERLYPNIVDLCHKFHLCTNRTSDLDKRIQSLRQSANNNENRLHDVTLLKLSVEKLRIDILFILSQLRTLFTGPCCALQKLF
ncbi:hypothetical protein V3C99_001614, partial [Haemonchus contortus]